MGTSKQLLPQLCCPLTKVRYIVAVHAGCRYSRVNPCLVCAQDLIRDAVIAGDGVSYERKALRSWLAREGHSPVSLLPLPSKAVVPNLCLQGLIEQLLRTHSSSMLCFSAGSRAEQLCIQDDGGADAAAAALHTQLLCPLTLVRLFRVLSMLHELGVMGCPSCRTQDIAQDAVLAADGFTYSRAAITQWLATQDVSPVTQKPLRSKRLVPNRSYSAVLEWLARCQAAKMGSLLFSA